MLTDKNFRLTSLQVNPIYKPVFDKLDALALKELKELDKSVLWSRKFTKTDFKYSFAYPAVIFGVAIYCIFQYGIRTRMYMQYVKHDRRLGLESRMDIDLDNVNDYPPSVLEAYIEKKKYDNHIKRKDEKIDKISDEFHMYLEKSAHHTMARRE